MYKINIPMMVIIGVGTVVVLIAGMWVLQLQKKDQEIAQQQFLEGISIYYPKSEVSALLYDGEFIWVGGRDGLVVIDPRNGDMVKEIANNIQMIYTAGMCQTVDRRVWVGYENGIAVFDGADRIDFLAPDIPSGRVNTVICDDHGGVWAGTETGAVHFVKKDKHYVVEQVLTSKEGLREDIVNAISLDNDHGIWFGAYLANKVGGLSILRDDQWHYVSTEEGLPHRYVTAIIPVGSEHMLVGGGHLERGGIALFKQNNDEILLEATYSVDNGLPGEKIRQLYLDSKGHLWITSESDGVLICHSYDALFEQQLNGVYLSILNGLSDNEIKTIIEVEGDYWLGGRYGLTHIEQATIEKLFVK